MTHLSEAVERPDDPDRFRKPAPVIELTPEVIANLRRLLDEAQKHASINGLPWRRGASGGKPLLYGGEEGRGACLAYGTIGSWNEIDLAVAAVSALPALLAALTPPEDAVERIVVGFSDKAILGLNLDEDDPRLSRICDEMRHVIRALTALPTRDEEVATFVETLIRDGVLEFGDRPGGSPGNFMRPVKLEEVPALIRARYRDEMREENQ